MGLTGDFRTLDRWERQIGSLASPALEFQASHAMATATLGFMTEQFDGGRDPFGHPWAPKKIPDGRPVGTGKTGQLKRYRIAGANLAGFKIHSPGAPYRKFFHGGTRRMKPRRISPGSNLPRRWSSAYQGIWARLCTQKLRG